MQNDLLNNQNELNRKLIHIGCSVLPLSYFFFFSREQIVFVSGFISIGFIMAEILIRVSAVAEKYFTLIFGSLLREDEKEKKITGATFLFVSLTIIFIFFDKSRAIPAALILTVGDSLAAIIGKKFGRRKFLNKSVTGSLTLFLSGNVILFIFLPGLGFLNLVISGVLTVIEASSLSISDNLTLPVSACLLMEVMFFIKKGVI